MRGWGIVGVNENPTKQDFNGLAFTLGQLLAYLHQMGVPEWNASQEYHIGSVATTANGVYRSLIANNIGIDPDTDDGTNWEKGATQKAVNERVIRVGSVAEIKAITPDSNYQVSLSGLRAGIFKFDSSDLSAEVASDSLEGIYIAPSSDPTGTSGAWVRQWEGNIEGASVTWYGADPTGLTDSSAAVQAAIDGNFQVYLPPGNYLVSGLEINKNNISIKGAGIKRSFLVAPASLVDVLYVSKTASSSGVLLEGFQVLGNSSAGTGIVVGEETTYASALLQMVNVSVYNFDGPNGVGVDLKRNQNTDFIDCQLHRNRTNLKRSTGGYSTSTRFSGKSAYLGGSGFSDYGLYIEGRCSDIYIQDSVVEGNNINAIYVLPSAVDTKGTHIYLDSCYFEANGAGGDSVVKIAGGTGNTRHTFHIDKTYWAVNSADQLNIDNAIGSVSRSGIIPSDITTSATATIHFSMNRYPNAGNYEAAYRALPGNISVVDFTGASLSDDLNQINYLNALTFPSSPRMVSDPNTLDAYEEGSYIPTVTGVSGTISDITGYYTIVGKTVTLRIVVQGSGLSVATAGGGSVSAPGNVQSVSAGTAFGVVPQTFLGGVYVTNSDDTLRLPAFSSNDLVIINATYDWSV